MRLSTVISAAVVVLGGEGGSGRLAGWLPPSRCSAV